MTNPKAVSVTARQVALFLTITILVQVVLLRSPGSAWTLSRFESLSCPRWKPSPLSYALAEDAYQRSLDSTFDVHGYIISTVDAKYNFARAAVEALNITSHQYVPLSYKSPAVDRALEEFNHGRSYHSGIVNLKMFSNRMAHTHLLHQFVNDASAKINSWRFFFEDDVALHPSLTNGTGARALVQGMELAAADGSLHLGICGPAIPTENREVIPGVNATRSFGCCSHAYGVTKWRAAAMLAFLDKIDAEQHTKMFYDLSVRRYGETVSRTWVLGSNLRSPESPWINHFGLLYQARKVFPSFVNAAAGVDEKSIASSTSPPPAP